ncbi:hypothetical protein SYNPS1DRAFT_18958 [Syncephalis pseudoplumigaleata]|uniref:F-box/LRR-repeat protein 15-like leucin rich repeat domain-containing protein n=1 Tax=Syncephalis pseudoplumigaleata TaxID=1712513 RepID=A0A4P9YTZ6_9FUNG|nr:hypothetical protein SYNPS1DRAFT_18958 [Syncephalis pseudoplumigaleata]|eukprot:RKP23218.1 hypothetical protein SYNPS1DRAFT_18958 [Syncephalis pseudoplumigaleata]
MLPAELLAYVAAYSDQTMLPVLARASRAFRDATLPWLYYAPQLTSIQQFRQFAHGVPDVRGRWVHVVDLSLIAHRWQHLSEGESLPGRLPWRPRLQQLDICWTPIRDAALSPILYRCGANLRELSLSNCNITDVSVLAIAEWCRQIRKLDLSGTEVGDPGLLAVANACQELQWLSLSGCEMITDEAVVALRAGCARLRWLDLEGCYGIVFEASIYTTAESENDEASLPSIEDDADAGWHTEDEF